LLSAAAAFAVVLAVGCGEEDLTFPGGSVTPSETAATTTPTATGSITVTPRTTTTPGATTTPVVVPTQACAGLLQECSFIKPCCSGACTPLTSPVPLPIPLPSICTG
jgi:hypothetical protein